MCLLHSGLFQALLACFESLSNMEEMIVPHLDCVGQCPVLFRDEKMLCFLYSMSHKSPWQAFSGQRVQVCSTFYCRSWSFCLYNPSLLQLFLVKSYFAVENSSGTLFLLVTGI